MEQTKDIRWELKKYMDSKKDLDNFLDQFFNYDFSQQTKELSPEDIQKWMKMEDSLERVRHDYLTGLRRLK